MLANFVLETANAPGTSLDIRLGGAKPGRSTFALRFANGAPCFYFVDDGTQAEWGAGVFTLGSPNTLSRSSVFGNTQGNLNRLNFLGAVDVYNEIPAERVLYIDNTNTVRPGGGALFDTLAGGIPIGGGMDFWGAVAPSGWVFAAGQELSRTVYARLFSVIGTNYGFGNGSTTFNCVDKRGRVSAARDDLGGPNANRLSAIIASNALGAVGGDQLMQAHGHGLSWSDPGHAHAVSDSGHNHFLNDPGHTHGVFDPSHAHIEQTVAAGVPQFGYAGGGNTFGSTPSFTTSANFTGISIAAAGIGAFNSASGVGLGIFGSFTGISAGIQVNGNGVQQNVQPTIMSNYIIFAGV